MECFAEQLPQAGLLARPRRPAQATEMLRELWDTATRPAHLAEDGSWARAAAALARGEGAMRFCSTLRDEDGAALARAAAHGAPSGRQGNFP